MSGLLFRSVEVDGTVVDVRVRDGVIAELAPGVRPERADEVVDGDGGALIPGLHDHHIHLLAVAAADESLPVGPPAVRTRAQFVAVLQSAARTNSGRWLRAVGYHESVAGELDRAALDTVVPDACVRVQHRSGALWVLNTRALGALGIESSSGRLYRADELVRTRLASTTDPPSLAAVGRRLATYGVTGVTDATPSSELSSVELLARAAATGEIPQRVVVTGGPNLAAAPRVAGVRWGPVKLIVADHALPAIDDLGRAIRRAHDHGRPVAVHCVTAVALALALAAWDDAGVVDGDRIEHGSVITPEAAARIAELGLVVVTQPGFVATRGDDYLASVDPDEQPFLYPCGSLIAHGVRVGGSTDAPFGELDPWQAVAAAVERRTAAGIVLGGAERVAPRRALELFLTPPAQPGGAPRQVTPGARADLCLLDRPLRDALASPASTCVAGTWVRGHALFRA